MLRYSDNSGHSCNCKQLHSVSSKAKKNKAIKTSIKKTSNSKKQKK